MKNKKIVIIMASLVSLIGISVFAYLYFFNEKQVVGKVMELTGQVEAQKAAASTSVKAFQGMSFIEGDTITTLDDGQVNVSLSNSKSVFIAPDTRVVFTELVESIRAKGGKTKLKLYEGKVIVDVNEKLKGDSRFQIETSNAIMGVMGTEFIVYFDGTGTWVIVLEGEVEVTEGNQQIVLVPNNKRIYIGENGEYEVSDIDEAQLLELLGDFLITEENKLSSVSAKQLAAIIAAQIEETNSPGSGQGSTNEEDGSEGSDSGDEEEGTGESNNLGEGTENTGEQNSSPGSGSASNLVGSNPNTPTNNGGGTNSNPPSGTPTAPTIPPTNPTSPPQEGTPANPNTPPQEGTSPGTNTPPAEGVTPPEQNTPGQQENINNAKSQLVTAITEANTLTIVPAIQNSSLQNAINASQQLLGNQQATLAQLEAAYMILSSEITQYKTQLEELTSAKATLQQAIESASSAQIHELFKQNVVNEISASNTLVNNSAITAVQFKDATTKLNSILADAISKTAERAQLISEINRLLLEANKLVQNELVQADLQPVIQQAALMASSNTALNEQLQQMYTELSAAIQLANDKIAKQAEERQAAIASLQQLVQNASQYINNPAVSSIVLGAYNNANSVLANEQALMTTINAAATELTAAINRAVDILNTPAPSPPPPPQSELDIALSRLSSLVNESRVYLDNPLTRNEIADAYDLSVDMLNRSGLTEDDVSEINEKYMQLNESVQRARLTIEEYESYRTRIQAALVEIEQFRIPNASSTDSIEMLISDAEAVLVPGFTDLWEMAEVLNRLEEFLVVANALANLISNLEIIKASIGDRRLYDGAIQDYIEQLEQRLSTDYYTDLTVITEDTENLIRDYNELFDNLKIVETNKNTQFYIPIQYLLTGVEYTEYQDLLGSITTTYIELYTKSLIVDAYVREEVASRIVELLIEIESIRNVLNNHLEDAYNRASDIIYNRSNLTLTTDTSTAITILITLEEEYLARNQNSYERRLSRNIQELEGIVEIYESYYTVTLLDHLTQYIEAAHDILETGNNDQLEQLINEIEQKISLEESRGALGLLIVEKSSYLNIYQDDQLDNFTEIYESAIEVFENIDAEYDGIDQKINELSSFRGA